jgi:hypothetical protein
MLERTRERRREAVERKLYFCTGCEHAFQTPFALEKHGRKRSCLALITTVPPTPVADVSIASVEPIAIQDALPVVVSTMEEGRKCLPAILSPASVVTLPTSALDAAPPIHATETVSSTSATSVEPNGDQGEVAIVNSVAPSVKVTEHLTSIVPSAPISGIVSETVMNVVELPGVQEVGRESFCCFECNNNRYHLLTACMYKEKQTSRGVIIDTIY